MLEWIKKFLHKLAKANTEEFGNKRMDCCNLNNKKS